LPAKPALFGTFSRNVLPNAPHASGDVRHVARRLRVRLLGGSPSEECQARSPFVRPPRSPPACAPAGNEVPVLVSSGPVTIQSCAIGSKGRGTMSQQGSPDMSDKGR